MIFNDGIQKHELKLEKDQKILDIGSGQYPFLMDGLDIVHIDKYPEENISRSSDFKEVENLIKMDILDMSFKDKEFDFVIAGDILEHVEDPILGCKEIMRVGKAGWIRCPTLLWEIMFGRKYHIWATDLTESSIIFYKKEKFIKSLGLNEDMRKYFRKEVFHNSFEWDGHFDVEVEK